MTINNRYEFVYFFDVTNGNPNGDPDSGNMPRIDPESSRGLVTDVCLKRKIRNFIELTEPESKGYDIYVKERSILNLQHKKAYDALGIKPESKKLPKDEQKAREIAQWMCNNFFDVRTFGAVMSTEINGGQVRGPVQIAFAKSIDPIIPLEISITRMAVTSEKESEAQAGGNRTMGRKYIVPYGLYRVHGFVSAKLAEKTSFNDADIGKLWQALKMMFEHDRSAARGEMCARKLIVFKHKDAIGNMAAHQLFDCVSVIRLHGENGTPAASFSDYQINVDVEAINNTDITTEIVF